MTTRYRVDSCPPGSSWDDGSSFPREDSAVRHMTRLVTALPEWSFRVVCVKETTVVWQEARPA